MSKFILEHKPVHVGVSIVGKEAYKDYRLTSTVRDPKKFKDFSTYRRITRKIWNKVAEDSVAYESGVYDKDFFYLIPQVIGNSPFVKMKNGKIRSNDHTNGDSYTPIFCNLFKNFNHFCWSLDGCYVRSYTTRMYEVINKFVPKYYFMLSTLKKNKL